MSPPELIDIGANLTHASFAADLDAVLAAAAHAGVIAQVVTGADLDSSLKAFELAGSHPGLLWSTAGVHPHHAAQLHAHQWDQFQALLRRPQVVAAGECGLDYFRNFSPREAQLAAFRRQLEWAVAAGKPVFLHQRDAHDDFVAVLAEYAPQLSGAVAHCFTEGPRELEEYLRLGCAIGVTGWVCDERRGQRLREAVPLIPAARLMVETDAPYLLPRDLRPMPSSRRNEPRYLPHVVRAIAALRGESFEAVASMTTANARAFFGLGAGPG
jgi:TatD DNase family protein